MKLMQLKRRFENNLGLSMAVLAVVILLIGSLASPFFTVLGAEDDEEKVEAPKWLEGDMWTYQNSMPMPGGELGKELVETKVEMEVTNVNGEVNIDVEDEDEVTYETYVVEETQIGEDDEPWMIDFHYSKENLAIIYNHPEEDVASGYHPPIVELDFPLYEGKEWGPEEARFFGDVHDEGFAEADRIYNYEGKVEELVTKEVVGEQFETYMVNLTIAGQDLIEGDAKLMRYEMYYSPEVKNIVHSDIFETMRVEDEDIEDDYLEQEIGNETLLEYQVTHEDPDTDEDESPFLSPGTALLIIVGTSLIYHYNKKYSDDKNK